MDSPRSYRLVNSNIKSDKNDFYANDSKDIKPATHRDVVNE